MAQLQAEPFLWERLRSSAERLHKNTLIRSNKVEKVVLIRMFADEGVVVLLVMLFVFYCLVVTPYMAIRIK